MPASNDTTAEDGCGNFLTSRESSRSYRGVSGSIVDNWVLLIGRRDVVVIPSVTVKRRRLSVRAVDPGECASNLDAMLSVRNLPYLTDGDAGKRVGDTSTIY